MRKFPTLTAVLGVLHHQYLVKGCAIARLVLGVTVPIKSALGVDRLQLRSSLTGNQVFLLDGLSPPPQ